MSRYSKYDKNDTYLSNLNYANLQKQKRNTEELKEIERDRIAMEKLQIELEQEKKLEKERKNQIRQQQYEDYSNYFKQKYSENPESREKLNIKLGGEQRYVRKPSYQQQMENLCLNPTRNKNIFAHTPIPNFSEAGRRNQRGYSHGYNILTGEVYPPELVKGKTPNNASNNYHYNKNEVPLDNKYEKNDNNANRVNNDNDGMDEKEKELREYQAYMEMKRKKEMELQQRQEEEELYYRQQQQKQNQFSQEKEIYQREVEREREREKELYKHNNNEQIPNNYQPPQKYNDNEYNQQEQYKHEKEELHQDEIPPKDKGMYIKENQANQIPPQNLEEIPPEYRNLYMREHMNENYPRPPYKNYHEEMNSYQPNREQIKPQESEYMPNKEKTQEDEYRQYLLAQQKANNNNDNTRDKDKEEEEIYQNMLREKELQQKQIEQEREKELYQNMMREKELQQKEIEQERNKELYQNMMKEKEKGIEQKFQEREREKEYNENMQREKELNLEKEKELYRQYLLSQQRKNQEVNEIKEQNINQNQNMKPNYINETEEQLNQEQYQYQERPEFKEKIIPKQEVREMNNDNIPNKPINSFEEYYRQKNINAIPEAPPEYRNQPENIPNNEYQKENENYPPYNQYPNEQNQKIYPPSSQEPLSEEQAYMMYQQQKQQEMDQIEFEKERARQILERQQKEKMLQEQTQNDYYEQNYSPSPYYNNNQMSEFNSAKMEYMKNRQKNLLTKDNIFSVKEAPQPAPKYNNEPLTNADRIRIQKEYAQFLDSQINAKNMRNNRIKNNGLNNIQSNEYEVPGPNPYQQMRDKYSKLKEIPQDPYSVKNYNISNNSYLSSNPITNPVNSYKFVDKRRVPNGRLQNNGSNVVGK